MSIKIISVKCPECGATLNIEENRKQAFCSYCGAKVLLQNDHEYVYRHIDEAGIKKAETDQMIQLRKMELEEKRRAEEAKTEKLKIIMSLSLATIGILMIIFGTMAGKASGDSNSGYYTISLVGMFPLMASGYIWLFSKNNKE